MSSTSTADCIRRIWELDYPLEARILLIFQYGCKTYHDRKLGEREEDN